MGYSHNKTNDVSLITQVAEDLCQGEGFELVHVEIVTWNRQTIIRVYADKPGGINLDECAAISRQLGDLLDVHLPDMGSYRLEVSSPGPHRPLKKKQDFQRFKGSQIKIETRMPIQGRKKFTGILEQIQDDAVVIEVDGERVEIPDLQIDKANLAGR
ncbi:MAG: ribosome maturation factor RimP [Desulfotignum sp.]|nr:ribosome maturation factor RimP [Desulfotignum sp.]